MHEQRALAGLLAAVGHRLVQQNVLERHLRHPQPGHRAWGYLNYILMPTLDVWRGPISGTENMLSWDLLLLLLS